MCENELPQKDIMINGLFYDYELMPTYEVFKKYISIHNELLTFVREKYQDIESEQSVAVHYRGTDFSTHLSGLFRKGIQVDRDYYIRAIEKTEQHLGTNVVYHLFSDELSFLEDVFKDKKVVIHDDEAKVDWVSMFLMKNIIQSNSTFSWTASLYNKKFSIMPKDGLNYHQSNGSVPFGFHHDNAILIFKNSKEC